MRMNSRETGGGGQTFPVERNQPSMVEGWANVLIGWQVNKRKSRWDAVEIRESELGKGFEESSMLASFRLRGLPCHSATLGGRGPGAGVCGYFVQVRLLKKEPRRD